MELVGPSPTDPRNLDAIKRLLSGSTGLKGASEPTDDTGSVSDPVLMRRVAMAMLSLDLDEGDGSEVSWSQRVEALAKEGLKPSDYIALCESPDYRRISHRLQNSVIVEVNRPALLKAATNKALMGSSAELKALLQPDNDAGSSAAEEVKRINQIGPRALQERIGELRETLRLLSQRAEARDPNEKAVREASAVATARESREAENARIDHRGLYIDGR